MQSGSLLLVSSKPRCNPLPDCRNFYCDNKLSEFERDRKFRGRFGFCRRCRRVGVQYIKCHSCGKKTEFGFSRKFCVECQTQKRIESNRMRYRKNPEHYNLLSKKYNRKNYLKRAIPRLENKIIKLKKELESFA